MKIKNHFIYIIALIIIVIDQFVKYLIISNMDLYQSIDMINNFFSLTYVINKGAAWSMLSGKGLLLIIFTILAVFFINKFCIGNKKVTKFETGIYGILYGGIFGNFIDRLFRGGVIDYLDFKIFNYDFPVFNIADICIVLSMILVICISLRGDKDENNNR